MLNTNGVPSKELIMSKYPDSKYLIKPIAIAECYEEIPCNPCATSCPFDAIIMVDNFPLINPDLCVSCGTCVRTCPKNVIELMPLKARVWSPCSTKALGKEVKEVCEVGCISCKICVKKCPAEAVTLEGGIIMVDHKKCGDYGPSCEEICVAKCPRNIMQPFKTGQGMLFTQAGKTDRITLDTVQAA